MIEPPRYYTFLDTVGDAVLSIIGGLLLVVSVAILLQGCGPTLPPLEAGIAWEGPIPDYTPPAEPQVAPDVPGACAPGAERILQPGGVAPCVGLLSGPAQFQYLLDVETQVPVLRRLLRLVVEGRDGDRVWADKFFTDTALKLVAKATKYQRQRWDFLGAGVGIGGALVGVLVLVLGLALR